MNSIIDMTLPMLTTFGKTLRIPASPQSWRGRARLTLACIVAFAIGASTLVFAQDTSAAQEIQAGMLDPTSTQARVLLANSYAQQYIPGDESAANTEMATQAIGEFKTVLKDDPTDQQRYRSTASIASLSLNLKRWDDAREYYMKAIELNPDDAHNYFSMGIIDWTLAYPPRVKMRDDMHLTDSEMISDPAACVSLRTQSQHYVEDGIQLLEKALQLKPDDDDAMAYMNLLYRERAEYECDQPDARKADLKAADEWVDKALAAKKAKAEKTTDAPH